MTAPTRDSASSPRTLLVDPDLAVRRWLTTGVGPRAGHVVGVAHGWEALGLLAERAWDLVVAGPHLADMPATSLLVMARGAGLETPFVIVLTLPNARVKAAARRMPPAQVVDDWTDGVALRYACEDMFRLTADERSQQEARRRLLRAAGRGGSGASVS